MAITTRAAGAADMEALAELLWADGQNRHARDPGIWPMAEDPQTAIASALKEAVTGEETPLRQRWILAEQAGKLLGAAHTILLPVPPIYAGALGPPGLILQDAVLRPDTPEEIAEVLLAAAEADLVEAGARILLAARTAEDAWKGPHAARGFAPLTPYLGKSELGAARLHAPVRSAEPSDIPAIVALSAAHRRILAALHERFWRPHRHADKRFGAWMKKSLGLTDRDMFVAGSGEVAGYAISQPITALHMPAGHACAGVGIIDDFYHEALADPATLKGNVAEVTRLLQVAEAARQARGDTALFVVCPADWQAKITLLEQAGYRVALIWSIKIRDAPIAERRT